MPERSLFEAALQGAVGIGLVATIAVIWAMCRGHRIRKRKMTRSLPLDLLERIKVYDDWLALSEQERQQTLSSMTPEKLADFRKAKSDYFEHQGKVPAGSLERMITLAKKRDAAISADRND